MSFRVNQHFAAAIALCLIASPGHAAAPNQTGESLQVPAADTYTCAQVDGLLTQQAEFILEDYTKLTSQQVVHRAEKATSRHPALTMHFIPQPGTPPPPPLLNSLGPTFLSF